MSFSADIKEEISKLKMWDINSNLTQAEQIARLCIRENFLKSGFMNEPNKEYHLEMLFKQNKKALEMANILENFDIKSKIIKKNKQYMLYIKEGEEISKFLALIGANSAVLKFEEIRVLRDTKNNVNRIVNCETANLNKTINAAVIQLEDIKLLKQKRKFNELPDMIKEVANLRIENPDSSLEEIGKLLVSPIGKSGVNHRFKKLHEYAEELRG